MVSQSLEHTLILGPIIRTQHYVTVDVHTSIGFLEGRELIYKTESPLAIFPLQEGSARHSPGDLEYKFQFHFFA